MEHQGPQSAAIENLHQIPTDDHGDMMEDLPLAPEQILPVLKAANSSSQEPAPNVS